MAAGLHYVFKYIILSCSFLLSASVLLFIIDELGNLLYAFIKAILKNILLIDVLFPRQCTSIYFAMIIYRYTIVQPYISYHQLQSSV